MRLQYTPDKKTEQGPVSVAVAAVAGLASEAVAAVAGCVGEGPAGVKFTNAAATPTSQAPQVACVVGVVTAAPAPLLVLVVVGVAAPTTLVVAATASATAGDHQ